jgi:hypothetical protein
VNITAERIDEGKLRCTGATWSDAVVILQGEALALINIERQAHALRAPAPGTVVETPPCCGTRSGRGRFRGGKNEPPLSSASTAASCGATWDDAVRAPLLQGGGVGTHHFGEDDFDGPARRSGSAPPDLVEDDFEAPPGEAGSAPPDLGEDDFEAPPREAGVGTPRSP